MNLPFQNRLNQPLKAEQRELESRSRNPITAAMAFIKAVPKALLSNIEINDGKPSLNRSSGEKRLNSLKKAASPLAAAGLVAITNFAPVGSAVAQNAKGKMPIVTGENIEQIAKTINNENLTGSVTIIHNGEKITVNLDKIPSNTTAADLENLLSEAEKVSGDFGSNEIAGNMKHDYLNYENQISNFSETDTQSQVSLYGTSSKKGGHAQSLSIQKSDQYLQQPQISINDENAEEQIDKKKIEDLLGKVLGYETDLGALRERLNEIGKRSLNQEEEENYTHTKLMLDDIGLSLQYAKSILTSDNLFLLETYLSKDNNNISVIENFLNFATKRIEALENPLKQQLENNPALEETEDTKNLKSSQSLEPKIEVAQLPTFTPAPVTQMPAPFTQTPAQPARQQISLDQLKKYLEIPAQNGQSEDLLNQSETISIEALEKKVNSENERNSTPILQAKQVITPEQMERVTINLESEQKQEILSLSAEGYPLAYLSEVADAYRKANMGISELPTYFLDSLNNEGLAKINELLELGKSVIEIQEYINTHPQLKLSPEEIKDKYNKSVNRRLTNSQRTFSGIFQLNSNRQSYPTATQEGHITGEVSVDDRGLRGDGSILYTPTDNQRVVNRINPEGKDETLINLEGYGIAFDSNTGNFTRDNTRYLGQENFMNLSIYGFTPLPPQVAADLERGSKITTTQVLPDGATLTTTQNNIKVDTNIKVSTSPDGITRVNDIPIEGPNVVINDPNRIWLRGVAGVASPVYITEEGKLGLDTGIYDQDLGIGNAGIVPLGKPGIFRQVEMDASTQNILSRSLSGTSLARELFGRAILDPQKGNVLSRSSAAQNIFLRTQPNTISNYLTNPETTTQHTLTTSAPLYNARVTFNLPGEEYTGKIQGTFTDPKFNLNIGGARGTRATENIAGFAGLLTRSTLGSDIREDMKDELEKQEESGALGQTQAVGMRDEKGLIKTSSTLTSYSQLNRGLNLLSAINPSQLTVSSFNGSFSESGTSIGSFFVGNEDRAMFGSKANIWQTSDENDPILALRNFNVIGTQGNPANITLDAKYNGTPIGPDPRSPVIGVALADILRFRFYDGKIQTSQYNAKLPTIGASYIYTNDKNKDSLPETTLTAKIATSLNLEGDISGLSAVNKPNMEFSSDNKIGNESSIIASGSLNLNQNLGRNFNSFGQVVEQGDITLRSNFNSNPTLFNPNTSSLVAAYENKLEGRETMTRSDDTDFSFALGPVYNSHSVTNETLSLYFSPGINLGGTTNLSITGQTDRDFGFRVDRAISEGLSIGAYYNAYSIKNRDSGAPLFNPSGYTLGIDAQYKQKNGNFGLGATTGITEDGLFLNIGGRVSF